jgi:hypothetical protein
MLLTPPITNQQATLHQHNTFGQGFAVFNPYVSAEGYQGMQQHTRGQQQSLASNGRDHNIGHLAKQHTHTAGA